MVEIASTGQIQLPKAIRDKIAAGEQAFQQLAQGGLPEEPPPQEPPPVEEPPPPVEEPPPPVEEPPAEPLLDDSAGLRAELSRVQQAYKTLQGRYNTDMRRQRDNVETLTTQLREVQQQVADLTTAAVLQQRKDTKPAPENKPLTSPVTYDTITPDELKEYGQDFFDMVGRSVENRIARAVEARLADLKPQVDGLSNQVTDLSKNNAAQRNARLHSWLDANLAGWREQDSDPLFEDWLAQEDPYSGVARKDILVNAVTTENYQRVKAIFEGFARETQTVAPTPRTRTPAGQPASARLSGQAAPGNGRARIAPVIEPQEVPLTAAQVKAYYDRRQRNPKSLTEAEITEMEARIARQLAAGTIRGGQRMM